MANQEQQPNKFTQPGRVKVVNSSILTPENAGLRFILNINNMAGRAENSLYSVIDNKWPRVKTEAKGWYNTRTGAYKLGAVNTTAVQSDVWVIHMIVQNDKLETQPEALKTCLKEVCKMAKYEHATVHVSTLLTNDIPEFKDLLEEQLVKQGISVSFYVEPTN